VSVGSNCGVRDHAVLLSEELGRKGIESASHWLQRSEGASLREARSQVRAWTRELSREMRTSPPAAVLLHYSVFAFSYRGLPVFVRPTLSALRASRRPIVSALHEFAFPWRYAGLRGDVWALSQRALLVEVMRTSAAVIVAADARAEWLASRPWLPKRPVVVTPVFSNLPAPSPPSAPARERPRVGMFGYSYEDGGISLVLDAIAALKLRGIDVELLLLGAPGRASGAGERWLQAAGTRGLADAISFSGRLPAQGLSDELAACDVVLFGDPAGPSSRKTTLAASLASGRPVVAIDGQLAWLELARSDAARVVPARPAELAGALAELLLDGPRGAALGARGRDFAERRMSVASSADAVGAVLDLVTHGQAARA
jgi:glycosyltransferase involved in cell wall biosynthesis